MEKIGSSPTPSSSTPKVEKKAPTPAKQESAPTRTSSAPRDSAKVSAPEPKGSVPHLDNLTSSLQGKASPGSQQVAEHMTAPPRTARGQINYGHNEEQFMRELQARGGTTTTEATGLEGVNRQNYSLPKSNPDGTPTADGRRWPEQNKTTFGQGWDKERIGQLHDSVFDGVKPQGNTAQVKVGDDYFVGKFKPDGSPDKFYMSGQAAEGAVTEKPPETLDRFRRVPNVEGAAEPRPKPAGTPEVEAGGPRPNAGTPEVRPPGTAEPVAGTPQVRPPAAAEPVAGTPEVRPPAAAEPVAGTPKGGAAPEAVAAESTLGRVTRVGGGGLAAGLGVVQAAHGVEELRNGNTLDGVTDTTGGVLNAAGGVALVAGSTVAAPLALAGAAGLDAGRTIIHGVQNGSVEQTAVGGVKALGATMMGAAPFVTGSIIGAPVGAVLGLGGAAVYGAASIYENREAIGNAVSNGAHAVSDWVGSWF